jgi:hypothetical protein
MSVHLSARNQAEQPPMGRALFVLLAAIVITGGVWLWVTAEAPAAGPTFVAWYAGAAAVEPPRV